MSVQRRKDNKGRVLKNGESQRKDGTYMYRYTDIRGKRRTVYSADLKNLRDKEEELEKALREHLDYTNGNLRVIDLIEKSLDVKQGLAFSTKSNYHNTLTSLKRYDFVYTPVKLVKISSAKQFIIELYKGRKYSTVSYYKTILSNAFKMACDDEIVQKNPFDFSLKEVIKKDSTPRSALTQEEVDLFFNYIHSSKCYRKYEDEFKILLGTGLRISEMYGLTFDDVDFKHRRIFVNHQLCYLTVNRHNVWKICPPKSESGRRYVPMSDEVYQCFQNVLAQRPHPETEPEVDGYTNFVFLSKIDGHGLRCENFVLQTFQGIEKSYTKKFPDGPKMPHITPHILRHTFCTNAINNGMGIKTVQYIMGHSSVGMTLGVYTHATQQSVFNDFYRISDMKTTSTEQSFTG